MNEKGPNVLITGGAGYIGSVLSKILLQGGFGVTVLDNFMYRQNSLLDCCAEDRFEVVRGDCRDRSLMKRLIHDKDVLIPLAALVGAPLCEMDRQTAEGSNLESIRMLCEIASPSQKILFPMTNSGYGIGEKDRYCTEETPLRPISLYGRTKVEAEKVLLDRGNAVTFRFATVFGVSPRMRMDLLVNDFVYRAVTDGVVVVFEGRFKRNYIHVRDVARVFLHGIRNFEQMRDRPYNVGLEGINLDKIELCELIKKVIPNFTFIEAPVGEDPDKRDYIVSNARVLAAGFHPEWDMARGIRELIRGYTILRKNHYANI